MAQEKQTAPLSLRQFEINNRAAHRLREIPCLFGLHQSEGAADNPVLWNFPRRPDNVLRVEDEKTFLSLIAMQPLVPCTCTRKHDLL